VLASTELRRAFGGAGAFLRSLVAELLLSMLLAPIIMISHTQSVLGILLGRSVGWNPQSREGSGTSWGDAWRFHAPAVIIGIFWSVFCWYAGPGFFWWMLPILSGLLLSVPLSVWTSHPGTGTRWARAGLWLTPEQTGDVPVAEAAALSRSCSDEFLETDHPERSGFVAAAVDPYVNAIHLSLAGADDFLPLPFDPSVTVCPRPEVELCLRQGPGALTAAEKESLLQDTSAMLQLHRSIWLGPGHSVHPIWLAAMESYRFGGKQSAR
jgi:membrane glycosyltransferase